MRSVERWNEGCFAPLRVGEFRSRGIEEESNDGILALLNPLTPERWNRVRHSAFAIPYSLVSVSSNIAEGFERQSNKEFVQFLFYAKGSVGELRTQLYISRQLGYLGADVFENLKQQRDVLSRKLGSFIRYLQQHSPKHR